MKTKLQKLAEEIQQSAKPSNDIHEILDHYENGFDPFFLAHELILHLAELENQLQNPECVAAMATLGKIKLPQPTLFSDIRRWGQSRGITGENGSGTIWTQFEKLLEEYHEANNAAWDYVENEHPKIGEKYNELRLELGDVLVALTLTAALAGLNIEDCGAAALAKISKRTGEMVDGVFVKSGVEP